MNIDEKDYFVLFVNKIMLLFVLDSLVAADGLVRSLRCKLVSDFISIDLKDLASYSHCKENN